jgi:hypothetical protein
MPLTPGTRDYFYRFASKRIDPADFERWLYEHTRLDDELDKTSYLDLLAFDFKEESGIREARHFIRQILEKLEPGFYVDEEVKQTLRDMINEELPLVTGLRRLVAFNHAGYEQIPLIFVGLESETDSVPEPSQYSAWGRLALRKQLKRLDWYKKDIIRESKTLLEKLERQTG